jgi:hypothetical protein
MEIKEPCNECICYPMCQNKWEIKCSILYEYVSRKITTENEFPKPKHFPKLMQISRKSYERNNVPV